MIDRKRLAELVKGGVVVEKAHKTLPLRLYNYAAKCQYERLWCDTSLQCRGLIFHGDEVVARPFRKFFNDTEHPPEEVPWHLPCEITEKLDGSLLIVFHFDGQWIAATRGSFESEQAGRGLAILAARYGLNALLPHVTYLFEVIYPGNRIVVDYGDREDVVLIGMFETKSGEEVPLDAAPSGLNVVRRLPSTANSADLRSVIRDEDEGYVVRFANGFRVKVKGERYMQLHRILSCISSRMVWEHLSSGSSFDDVLGVVPDEFSKWVIRERDEQYAAFNAIMVRTCEAVSVVRALPTRKDKALRIIADYKDVSAPAFCLLDGKDASAAIWKGLYPPFRVPERLAALEH